MRLLVLLCLMLVSGCVFSAGNTQHEYVCPGGQIVNESARCPEAKVASTSTTAAPTTTNEPLNPQTGQKQPLCSEIRHPMEQADCDAGICPLTGARCHIFFANQNRPAKCVCAAQQSATSSVSERPALNISGQEPDYPTAGEPFLLRATVGNGTPAAGVIAHLSPAGIDTMTDMDGYASFNVSSAGVYYVTAGGYDTDFAETIRYVIVNSPTTTTVPKITCMVALDCGAQTTQKICIKDDVYLQSTSWECSNPGTPLSQCKIKSEIIGLAMTSFPTPIEKCRHGCKDGLCLP